MRKGSQMGVNIHLLLHVQYQLEQKARKLLNENIYVM